jgi:16S rRNA (guanine527-N7)-methyltransferase
LSIAKSGSDAITIHWRIDQWFPEISQDIRVKLKKFQEELLRFNKTLPLIGVKTIPVSDAIHFADSILGSKLVAKDFKDKEIYDLGSGNGFPGIVFALLHPQIKVHLVDNDPKKVEFLKHVITNLSLGNCDVIHKQAETLPAGSINAAMSRDFGVTTKCLLMTRRIFKTGGVYYHFKGEEWATEIADIPTQLCSFWQPSLLGDYKLPIGEIKFAVVKTVKIEL